MQSKVGRNDPCPCGSGKKYKKCCELKKGPRFTAQKIENAGSKLSGLFQSHVKGFLKEKPSSGESSETP